MVVKSVAMHCRSVPSLCCQNVRDAAVIQFWMFILMPHHSVFAFCLWLPVENGNPILQFRAPQWGPTTAARSRWPWNYSFLTYPHHPVTPSSLCVGQYCPHVSPFSTQKMPGYSKFDNILCSWNKFFSLVF